MDAGRLCLALMVLYFALYLIPSPISVLFFWAGIIMLCASSSCFAASAVMLHKLAKLKRNAS